MKLEIYSFEGIQARAEKPFEANTTLISIGDPGAPAPELAYKPEKMLRLEFDDITHEEVRERLSLPPLADDELEVLLAHYNTFLFSDELAQRAASFILENAPHTNKFICQCRFGQSRSAAVAAAVAEFFGGHGNVIFGDKRYSPNKLVYRKLLAALKSQTE